MIEVLKYDSKPISFMGKVAGVCWGANLSNEEANYKRGIECIENNHGRVEEFADVVLVIDGYSARVIRELYTHVIGTSRLQSSTRYIDYSDFDYYTPIAIKKDEQAKEIYDKFMKEVGDTYESLLGLGIKKEDIGNILPLGTTSKIVLKINVRALFHMFELRTCGRAYEEFRTLMIELRCTLRELDEEWEILCKDYFKPKCMVLGYCNEKYSCGLMPKKEEI